MPVARTKIALFVMCSCTASLMGIIEALELRSMQAKEGIGLEFIFIICAVVGGCLLTGGYGSVIGTFFGACILGMVQLGIVDSQWDSNWTYAFEGAILFAAVLLNTVDPQPRAEGPMSAPAHLLEVDGICKYYGNVVALKDITTYVNAGEVTCILGDNGAGKSTFIKILSGVHAPDEGRLLVDGQVGAVPLAARRARGRDRDRLPGSRDGAAHVHLAELLPRRGAAEEGAGRSAGSTPRSAKQIVREELHEMGIDIRDPDQPVGTLSGGERQSVAIARAVHFGARVLILDEPTSALGVKQAGVVLQYILQARERGIAVIFITHNPHHAYPVGDRFVILNRGPEPGQLREVRDRQRRARPPDGGRS